MTKITIRDRIWDAALTLAEEKQDRSTWGRRFKPADVANRMDDPPSRRTIRETMAAMAEFGRLKKGRSKGQYEPPPEPDEPEEESSSKDRNVSSGFRRRREQESSSPAAGVIGGPELAQQMREEQREADQDQEADEGRQEAPQSYVADLDLPGDDSTLEARKRAVRACYDYLRREGTASKQDFINDVRPDHPARYGSAGGWWNTIGKKGLRELARARDDIQAPVEGRQTWRHTPPTTSGEMVES